MTVMRSTVRTARPALVGRRWWVFARGAALAVWAVAVVAAAGAVTLVLAMHRSGVRIPEVYLDNIWPALVLPAVGLLLIGRAQYRLAGWLFTLGGLLWPWLRASVEWIDLVSRTAEMGRLWVPVALAVGAWLVLGPVLLLLVLSDD